MPLYTIADNIGLCGVLTASRVLGGCGVEGGIVGIIDKEWRAIFLLKYIGG